MEYRDALGPCLAVARVSLIFISHDLAVVGALCNRTLVMRNARVVEEAPTRDILIAPLNPYARSLVNAARELEPDGRFIDIPAKLTSVY